MSRAVSINNQFAHAGLAVYFDEAVREPAHAARVAKLLLDERWPWLPWYLSYSGIDREYDRGSKRVNAKTGVQGLAEGILNPQHNRVVARRAAGDKNFTEVQLDTGRIGEGPFRLQMTCRVAELPEGKSTAAWLELVRDMVRELSPANGILGVWPAFDAAISDVVKMRMLLDTRWGVFELGVLPDVADPTRSFDIGRTYARYPRWGTYLSDAHLAAIGGVERIQAEVAPATIERIGTVTYIQLTDTIETAMSLECGERRQRLQAIMAPVLAPRSSPTRPAAP